MPRVLRGRVRGEGKRPQLPAARAPCRPRRDAPPGHSRDGHQAGRRSSVPLWLLPPRCTLPRRRYRHVSAGGPPCARAPTHAPAPTAGCAWPPGTCPVTNSSRPLCGARKRSRPCRKSSPYPPRTSPAPTLARLAGPHAPPPPPPGARGRFTPVIKLEFDGIEIDLLYAPLGASPDARCVRPRLSHASPRRPRLHRGHLRHPGQRLPARRRRADSAVHERCAGRLRRTRAGRRGSFGGRPHHPQAGA